MPRSIRSIEIYLPLDYNDGRAIPESKYVSLQRKLLIRYGGVASTQRQFPLQGMWRSGTRVYHDRVVVFSVMDFREESMSACMRYLEMLKDRLKKRFDQLEILITVSELLAV
jgi:hypothetical protein